VRPITVTPDWICESPTNEAHDRVRKRHLYARCGVAFYWIVDPAARTVEALDAGSHDDTETARVPPFEAVELEVGRLFPPR
jgi:Uma2 family endonuclease